MKRMMASIFICGVLFSQTKMLINKTDGKTDTLILSDIKNISFFLGNITPASNMMIKVTGGIFTMGSEIGWINGASPSHTVSLSDFYISKFEITWKEWDTVYQWAKNNGYTDIHAGEKGYLNLGTENHPVTMINWYDAVKWCNARSQMEQLTPVYYSSSNFSGPYIYKTGQIDIQNTFVNWSGNGYRLPTEAEWEYSAQGGANRHIPPFNFSGSDNLDDVGWYNINSGSNTHSTGTKGANELGLYDMSGNVFEWCWDWNGSYSIQSQNNPYGPTTGTVRIHRGGSFHYEYAHSHVSNRNTANANVQDSHLGFRISQKK